MLREPEEKAAEEKREPTRNSTNVWRSTLRIEPGLFLNLNIQSVNTSTSNDAALIYFISFQDNIKRSRDINLSHFTPIASYKSCSLYQNSTFRQNLGISRRRLSDSDLSHVSSVGEVVIARAHVTILPRPRDAETRWVAGGWGVVQLSLQFGTDVTSLVEVKIQLGRVKFIHVIHNFKRQTGTSWGFERTTSFLYPANVGAIRT